MASVDRFYRAFIYQAVQHEQYWLYRQSGAVPLTFAGTAIADVSNLLNIIEALTGEDFRAPYTPVPHPGSADLDGLHSEEE